MDQINGEDTIKKLMKALYSWKNQWLLPVWAILTLHQYIIHIIYILYVYIYYYVTQVWMGIGQWSANCATASDFQNIFTVSVISHNMTEFWPRKKTSTNKKYYHWSGVHRRRMVNDADLLYSTKAQWLWSTVPHCIKNEY